MELNKNENLISVILPIYNGAKYLDACLKSILNQTYRNFEIIAIDDNSKDKSLAVIKSISDKRIKIFSNETNIGLAASLNRAIELSSGSILVRIDQDDIMEKKRLAIVASEFAKDDKIELIFSQAKVIDVAGKKIGTLALSRNRRNTLFTAIFINVFTHSAAAFTKESIIRIGGYPVSSTSDLPEDFATWSEYLRINPRGVFFIRENLVQYRKNPQGMTSQNPGLKIGAALVCQNNLNNYLKNDFKFDTIEYISRKLYNLKAEFKFRYFFDIFRLLVKLNALVNKENTVNDIRHILHIYSRVLVPLRMKHLILSSLKLFNKSLIFTNFNR